MFLEKGIDNVIKKVGVAQINLIAWIKRNYDRQRDDAFFKHLEARQLGGQFPE